MLSLDWEMNSEDLAHRTDTMLCSALPELGVIRVSGPEAADFLNRVFCNRMDDMKPFEVRRTGWADPKGRLMMTASAVRTDDAFLLVLPEELAAETAKRLRMYVLRSKVTAEDETALWNVTGFTGRLPETQLFGVPLTALPEGSFRAGSAGGGSLAAEFEPLESGTDENPLRRILILTKKDSEYPDGFEPVPGLSSAHWWKAEILSSVPTVFKKTSGRFIPQDISFDLAHGVCFSKGCYPGQEVIGRVHMRNDRHLLAVTSDKAEIDAAEAAELLVMSVTENGLRTALVVRKPA